MRAILIRFLRRFANFSISYDGDGNPSIPNFDLAEVRAAFKARKNATPAQRLLRRRFTFYRLLRRMVKQYRRALARHYGDRKQLETLIRRGKGFRFRVFYRIDLSKLATPISCTYCIFVGCDFTDARIEDSNLEGTIFVRCDGTRSIARRSNLMNFDGLALAAKRDCFEETRDDLLSDDRRQEEIA